MNEVLLCVECNNENDIHAKRCIQCDSRLPAMVTKHVRDGSMAEKLRFSAPKMPKPSSNIVVLHLVGRSSPLVLESRPQMVFGRRTPGTRELIVDLALFHGGAMGVSRKHATLHRTTHGYYMEDMNSTNGTRINGFQLTPRRKYRLRDGDEVEFARLRAVFNFVRTSN